MTSLHVTHERHVGGAVLADLSGVDVGVDDPGLGRESRQLSGHAVIEACAQSDQQVGLLQRGHRGDRAVHPRHPEMLRVRVGERAARHQRRDDRNPGQLSELAQVLGGVRLQHAATDVQDWPLAAADQPGGLADLLGVRLRRRPVARQVELDRPLERRLGLERVLGDVHEHRTRTTGGRDVERLRERARDVSGVLDQEVVLGDRHRDPADVGLLERVGSDRR